MGLVNVVLTSGLHVRLAQKDTDIFGAQRLRYQVFVEELGADGPLVNHESKLEIDQFDSVAEQLILVDPRRPEPDHVVGVYRMMDRAAADRAGRFYSADEYDLMPLLESNRALLELGRSCIHPDYRGGPGMMMMWRALAQEVRLRGTEILFGVASFHGASVADHAAALSLLGQNHLAPDNLRVRSKNYQTLNQVEIFDKVAALKQVPSLIKAYLRLGGFVGDGAYVDEAFNTTDVCLILDIARMNARQKAIYQGLT